MHSTRLFGIRFALSMGAGIVLALSSFATGASAGPGWEKIDRALATGERPVRIVCFGDSVTGVYYHTGGERAYTDMLGIALRRLHPKADVSMINAGISGHTTANVLARIDEDVIAHRPDLVTVMFGLNDMVKLPIEAYRKNLTEIVRRCRAAGAGVILCTPNAIVSTDARPVEKLVRYCEVVREVAAEREVPLCDSYAEFEAMADRDRDAWLMTLSGEIHPNMAGHKAIAEQIARTITGRSVSLADVGPPADSLGRVRARLGENSSITVLAMPPFDGWIGDALIQPSAFPDAAVTVKTWPVEGMSRPQIRKDASHRVRKMKPDFVLVAIPRSAGFESREQFIEEQMWIVNHAQSFGRKEWAIVVVHPSVAEPSTDPAEAETDELIRTITAAQDLPLIDRKTGDDRSADEILSDWIARHSREKGSKS